MLDAFNKKSQTFVEWFASRPGATFSDKIALHDYRGRGGGRGLIALDNIAEDEVLFSIPRTHVLSAATSDLAACADDLPEDPWLGLILVLIYEHLKGSQSTWKPYLDVLPTAEEFNTLMYWTDLELEQLQASAVRDKIGRASADTLFRAEIIPFINRHSAAFYSGDIERLADDQIVKLAHRMGSTIMAYAFDLEPSEEANLLDDEGFASDDEDLSLPKGMLPMADMLNADADANAHLMNGNEVLKMTALRGIHKGQEILNDYGPLPRSDLLRRYGYLTPKYRQYDVVEIPYDLLLRHVKTYADSIGIRDTDIDQRLEFLDDSGLLDEGYDVERGDISSENAADRVHIPEEILQLLKTLLVTDVSFKKLHRMTNAQSASLVRRVGQVSQGILKERLSQYSSTLDDDRAARTESGLTDRHRMAIEVRLGEKELLHDAIALAQSWSGGETQAVKEPAQKKRRTE